MGGWTCLEYVLKDPRKVRALVLTSTCGSIDRASVPLAEPNRLNEWDRMADAARADMARRGISPPAGERMAKEQPSLHYLYREIANASAAFDRAVATYMSGRTCTMRHMICPAAWHMPEETGVLAASSQRRSGPAVEITPARSSMPRVARLVASEGDPGASARGARGSTPTCSVCQLPRPR